VEHIWAVGENEDLSIRNYPGNYTQYRLSRAEKIAVARAATSDSDSDSKPVKVKGDYSAKLSYKEKFEFEKLGPLIEQLEVKRDTLSAKLETCNSHEDLIKLGDKLGNVTSDLDEAEMRWLELAERA
ncbi:MAG TPA: hypothetical protein EYF95_07695, partial [Flavobacteriales bacterium]|nr:hypothetical protein [Flavobacteriales bacterium]